MNWSLVITVGCLAVCLGLLMLLQFSKLHQEGLNEQLGDLKQQVEELQRDLAAATTKTSAYRELCSDHAGGVGKRVVECRYIAEAIERYCPEAYGKEHGLIFWLSSMDEFLVRLHAAFDPDGRRFPLQAKLVASKAPDVYLRVQAELRPQACNE